MTTQLALALLLLALLFGIWAVSLRRRTGLPWVPVVLNDTLGRELVEPLFAKNLGLVGKPDYLLGVRGGLVPVEVKPHRTARVPYDADLMQLAAYCVLVEETEGHPPPYGLLRYAERTFRLTYTPAVRQEVLQLLHDMRDVLDADDCARSHDERRRCHGCGFFEQCDEALT